MSPLRSRETVGMVWMCKGTLHLGQLVLHAGRLDADADFFSLPPIQSPWPRPKKELLGGGGSGVAGFLYVPLCLSGR